MRLSRFEQDTIKKTILSLDKDSKIVLFGSRADDTKKGGDIDLLILSKKLTFDDKLKILSELYEKLGEQKIDIVMAKNKNKTFVKVVLESGILL